MYNNLHKRSDMVTKMIRNILVNAPSHLVSIQSSKLIMTITQHYVPDERIVRSVIGEMVLLDLRLDNIEKVFYLSSLGLFPWYLLQECQKMV